ncbi:MAG: amino acid ABC transporter substrate-binding protein [Clostridiaceae bacterium]|nr:amino acid ABC transporter substrate-binding protein [Clostridiaceae bacterium]
MITLIGGLVLTACSGAAPKAPKDGSLETIKKAGKIVIGLDDSFPPMGFRDENNEIVGFDIDMAKEAAKRIGVEPVFQPIDWNSKELELQGKKIDLIWNGLTITEERKKQMAFTEPYLENRQIIVVKAGSDIKTKKDLAGKVVGLQEGSSSLQALEKDEETLNSLKEEPRQYSNNNEALLDLSIGRIDAVVVDEVVGRYYISKKPGEYEILEEHFGSEEYGVGLRLEDKALLNELQRILNEMKKDGTSAKISQKWFGEDVVK